MLLSSLPRGPWWKALCCQRWSTVSLCVAIGMVSVCVKVSMRRRSLRLDSFSTLELMLLTSFAREVLFSSWRSCAAELWGRDSGLTLVCAFTNLSLSMYTHTSWECLFRVGPRLNPITWERPFFTLGLGHTLVVFFLLVCSSFAPTTLIDGQSRQGFPEMADEISEV